MTDKRKKQKFAAKREKRRLKRLAEDGRLINGVEIPNGAIAADVSQQVPNNSYSPPPLYYIDKEFVCVDCGRKEIWTGRQQKWYYEVAKGSLYATAIRCRNCRKKHAEQHRGHGDPNPIKHVGSLMKRIRNTIEPWLVKAGFEFDGHNKWRDSGPAWLDYSRPGLILRCLFDPREARLVADTMDDNAECAVVANIELRYSRSSTALLAQIDDFSSAIREFLRTLPVSSVDK